jgi:geranylgeranyl reductase family protein
MLSAQVVIVGGGPAGASTAIALARRGVDVLLFDRAKFPRDKVCGDVLLPEVRSGLQALGLDVTRLGKRAYRCTGARYVGPRGPQIAGDFADADGNPRPWWMVRRREFDEWLLAEASRAGASVIEGIGIDGVLRDGDTVCGVRTRGRNGIAQHVTARAVVGADGVSSVIAREVGAFNRFPDHTCLAARAYVRGVTLPAPQLEVFTTSRTLPGCAWIVPVSADEVNVGIGVVQSTAQRLAVTPQELFAEVRRESPLLDARLRGCEPIALKGWALAAATEHRRLAGPGWVLVGDAGAMVDPFTGHGIHNAIVAGRIAGDTIADAIASDDRELNLLAYEARCRSALDDDVQAGRLLQRLHAHPRLMHAAAEACARHAGLRSTFLALVGHSAPRPALLSLRALARAMATIRDGAAA